MTPLGWMAGAFEALLIPTGSYNHDNWVGVVCFIFAGLVLLFYGGIYLHFAFRDPDRLQTEEFNLLSKELTLKTGMKDVTPVLDEPVAQISISASELPINQTRPNNIGQNRS